MGKNIKTKKNSKINNKVVEKDVKKVVGEEEEVEKETGSTLSDGVLDAFEELAPVDPLLEDEATPLENEDEEDIDSGDYRPNDEW